MNLSGETALPGRGAVVSLKAGAAVAHPTPKEAMTKLGRVALRSFLDSGCILDCRPAGEPKVSVLMLVWNRAELTLACLQSLALRSNRLPIEIVVVDNGSTDETSQLLERVRGLKVHRNGENAGFPAGVNQAARLATGEFLLLLNNDTEVLGKSIDVAADFLAAHPDVGAVGGKVVLLDGTLQEGGCLILRDGSPQQQGRGEEPTHPDYNFQRDVDYCSGVFLMTPRALFGQLGGLDEALNPGYFEDTDYCVRLQKRGYRIVYLPDASVLHYENATSAVQLNVPELFQRNWGYFTARHQDWLQTQPAHRWPAWVSRIANRDAFKVLILGDAFLAGSSPEGAWGLLSALLSRIESLDGFVTLCLTGAAAEALQPMLERRPKSIELVCGKEMAEVRQRLLDRPLCYDLVLLSDAADRTPLGLPWLSSVPCAVWSDGELRLLRQEPCTARQGDSGAGSTLSDDRISEAA
jgi:GT2 family glycosyltransferase